ncbi:MAG: porphobilinogen synthase [Propionibacteriaceae bacterium]|jgi:porphobilinogen synthase|nr:porphobilinogen synthase [Propionibacteriaceae bacterium]
MTTPSLVQRPRRLRANAGFRRLVQETRLSAADLVLPLFVKEGLTASAPIESMPGQVQHSEASLPTAVKAAVKAGLGGIMLFGIPARRDAVGSEAVAEDGILQRGLRSARQTIDDLTAAGQPAPVLMADTCLDEFTDHGHCGLLRQRPDGQTVVDNDSTLTVYGQMACLQAAAGADVVSPSGMMDGQVGVIRAALDQAGFTDTAILAYSAKYASAFYGPFREAVDSTLVGDRRTYQMDPANAREGWRETALDLAQGADIVMVKPAGTSLDILHHVARRSDVPVAAYQVSGEYAMIEAAAGRGWIDRQTAIIESVTAIKRAGANIILTYWALELADWLMA